MKKNSRGRPKQWLAAISVVAVMLMMTIIPAVNVSATAPPGYGAERITYPGIYDGIVGDPHNSYAWCGEVFNQDGTDYLWVGTNRDMLSSIMALTGLGEDYIYTALGTLPPSSDQAAKIYRLNLEDSNAEWELMYENAAFNGYRKMIVYDTGDGDELYVFAGLTNRFPVGYGYNYSAVYRFSSDAKPMDDPGYAEPDVVLWSGLTTQINAVPPYPEQNVALEYYRAACVHDGILFVGTFDCMIYYTDMRVSHRDPNNAFRPNQAPLEDHTGWGVIDLAFLLGYDPAADAADGRIWDIIGFGDALYVFVASNGFRVYKVTDSGSGVYDTAVQIIGNEEAGAKWPAGMGVYGGQIYNNDTGSWVDQYPLVAASPFIMSVGGNDYVYVTTFANGPDFLLSTAAGVFGDPDKFADAFSVTYCPAFMFRFDLTDKWEVVVGDEEGQSGHWAGSRSPYVTVDFADSDHSRAGFYVGNADGNPSANLYIWWMAQDKDGRIWASTWDMIFMRDAMPMALAILFASGYNDWSMLMPTLNLLIEFALFMQQISEIAGLAVEAAGLVATAATDLYAALLGSNALTEVPAIMQKLYDDLVDLARHAVDILNPEPLGRALLEFTKAALNRPLQTINAFSGLVQGIFDCGFYLIEYSNPTGFDLFYSDDGLHFEPYTVNGMGDKNNYGGRVILPTADYGLFLFTANPFTGAQIWRISDDISPDKGIYVDAPAKIQMKVGGTASFYVMTTALDGSAGTVTLGDGTVVDVSIEMVEYLGPSPKYYFSEVYETSFLGFYDMWREYEIPVPMYLYEVTMTGLRIYDGGLALSLEIDSMTYNGEIQVEITKDLAGTVTIDKTSPRVGDTLTANTSGLNNTGILSYQWKANGANIGVNSATYTVTEADLGKSISVVVTSSVEMGSVTSAGTSPVANTGGSSPSGGGGTLPPAEKKTGPPAPPAPTVESKTQNSVTLVSVTGYQYSKDGSTWQDSNTFSGLEPGTEYTFYQRVKETSDTLASVSSPGVNATTEPVESEPASDGGVSIVVIAIIVIAVIAIIGAAAWFFLRKDSSGGT